MSDKYINELEASNVSLRNRLISNKNKLLAENEKLIKSKLENQIQLAKYESLSERHSIDLDRLSNFDSHISETNSENEDKVFRLRAKIEYLISEINKSRPNAYTQTEDDMVDRMYENEQILKKQKFKERMEAFKLRQNKQEEKREKRKQNRIDKKNRGT